MMTIDATGLSTYWGKQFRPPKMDRLVQQCINWKRPVEELTRLSLKGLSGAFLALCIGYVVAIFTFIIEMSSQALFFKTGLFSSKMITIAASAP